MSKENDYLGDYDGCSGGMSKLWRFFGSIPPWEGCCDTHDIAYAKGGTAAERLANDLKMMLCVIKRGYPKIAVTMFILVRIGGVPWLPTPYRWGFETNRYTYTKEKL